MHVCINNSEGKDRCLPLYLPFHMEDYAIDIFPIKKMKCDFHQLPQSKKEKSNQQWKIGPNIFLYFSCQSNKMSSITFSQIGFFTIFWLFSQKRNEISQCDLNKYCYCDAKSDKREFTTLAVFIIFWWLSVSYVNFCIWPKTKTVQLLVAYKSSKENELQILFFWVFLQTLR